MNLEAWDAETRNRRSVPEVNACNERNRLVVRKLLEGRFGVSLEEVVQRLGHDKSNRLLLPDQNVCES